MTLAARRWQCVPLMLALAGCGGGATTAQLKQLNVQSRLDIASAAAAAGVSSVATNLLAEAAAAAPGDAGVQQRYVRALADAGRFSEAGEALDKAVRRLPDSLVLRYEVARLDILQGAPRQAIGPLQQIVRSQPDNVSAWCAEGVAFDMLGNAAAADAAYGRAASLAPYDRIVANDRAVSLVLRGQPDAAERVLRDAARQNPPNSRIINNLALADGLAGNANGVTDLLGNGTEANMAMEAAHILGSPQDDGSTSSGANDAGLAN